MSKRYNLWVRIEEYDTETKEHTSDPDIMIGRADTRPGATHMAECLKEWVKDYIEDGLG